DGWSQEQIQKYVQKNAVQVPFSKHATSTLKGVLSEPTKYFEASVYIFVFVFTINWLIIGWKKSLP
ncbi:MAG: hypothetical protein U1B30_09225, partial [Pseudomonadota bacterium]|nr:hypothetical protein [Pseudomonadota bacterium]